MNMLASLKNAEGVKIADEKDVLGGGGVFDSGLYEFKVGMAYTKKSDGGALGLFLTLVTDEGREMRYTTYMTSGNDKGNKTYYTKDGENFPLPGFSLANSLAELTTGKEIAELETEDKVIKLYNSDSKAEVPTTVPVIVELIGQRIIAGVVKIIDDKNVKDASGKYVASGETREINDIDKFFCARDSHKNMTRAEIKAGATEATFYKEWETKNAGKVRNKAKGASGTAGVPAAAGTASTPKPKTSLFGNKE